MIAVVQLHSLICFSLIKGDSGGPLYTLADMNGKQKYVLAGISSFLRYIL